MAAGIGPLGAAAIVAGVLALGIGATTLSQLPAPTSNPEAVVSETVRSPLTSRGAPAAPTPAAVLPTAAAVAPAPAVKGEPAASTPEIPIRFSPDGPFGFPDRPTPTRPAEPGTTLPPGTGPAPAVVASAPSSTYLAPVFSGTVRPDTTVAVQVAANTYHAVPDATGAWTFDLRSLQLPAGPHTATVWTIADGVSSRAASMPFTIDEIALGGFPDSYPSVTLRDGMGGGLPFSMTGAPNGSICIDSDTGQSAVVPLDASGQSARVLRFYNYGIYILRMSACAGDSFGPEISRVVSVTQGVFDPYVLDDVMYWDISEF